MPNLVDSSKIKSVRILVYSFFKKTLPSWQSLEVDSDVDKRRVAAVNDLSETSIINYKGIMSLDLKDIFLLDLGNVSKFLFFFRKEDVTQIQNHKNLNGNL